MRISVVGLTLSVALACVFTPGAEARDRVKDSPHLRPVSQAEATFVSDALRKSPTVSDVNRTIEQGDLVTYIHLANTPAGEPDAMLRFAGRSKYQRFVVLTIEADLPRDRQIALLAHELQHVAELTRVTWVSSQADFHSMMALLGWRDGSTAIGYETSAALAMERRVARELIAAGRPKP